MSPALASPTVVPDDDKPRRKLARAEFTERIENFFEYRPLTPARHRHFDNPQHDRDRRALPSLRALRRPGTMTNGGKSISALMTQQNGQSRDRVSVAFALGAAAFFGASAPAGKALLAVTDPWLLAGLLYLGSGVSLGAFRLMRRLRSRSHAGEAPLGRNDWPWLGAAILTGGVIAPVLLMFGLSRASAAEASLLLNLEGVFTAVVAWVVFREHVDRRIAGGMVAISAGAMVLAWDPGAGVQISRGALLVAGACLGWASTTI